MISKIRRSTAALAATTLLLLSVIMPAFLDTNTASAQVTNGTAEPKVSFTFDDGYDSSLTQAAPTLKKYGYTGTVYIPTACMGMTTAPNTCRANTDATYMSWAQVTQLQNTYGWEIGSHTTSHAYLATSDPVDQPQKLTDAQAEQELSQSKQDLASHGFDAVSFAPPYGDYDMSRLRMIAKYYQNMRGFQDTGYNSWPYMDYLIRDQHVEGNTTVATVKSYIDTAIANNQWLVLTFHNIKTTASTNPDDYEYSTANLDAIAAYVKSKNVKVTNVKDALVKSDVNLVANSSFNSGIASGWLTDSPSTITVDSNSKGSYPDATKSIKMTSTSSAKHLFTPQIPVTSTEKYVIKSYLDVQAITSGELGFYIDEYDSLGNWVSGQYKGGERNVFTEELALNYTPTSSAVKYAQLQFIVTANSGITAYLDNVNWFSLASTSTPISGKISQVNNLANGKTFTSTVGESTLEPGHPLTYINDTNESSRWISLPQNNASLTVDLGTTYNLSKVSILWAGDTTKNYTVQVSTNNSTWTTVATGLTNNTSPQLIDHANLGATAAGRYIRINCLDRWNTSYGNSIWELGIYGALPSLVNGTFDGGIANGWTTNSAAAFTANSANHGSPNNAVNSVALKAGTANASLFAPQVAVSSTKSYNLAVYANILTFTSGELGFYIDEYDANGNWVSGQYKGGIRSISSGDATFAYTPTSASVAKASLQIILVGNSGITGYVDDIRWY